MLVKIDLNSDLFNQIEKLVSEGKYEDFYQFLKIAINNQLQEEKSEVNVSEKKIPESSANVKLNRLGQALQQRIVNLITEVPLEKSEIIPPSKDLIWSFYTRFFPIKVAIRKLATLLYSEKKWIKLQDLQDEAFFSAEAISDDLRGYEEDKSLPRNEKISTGLPLPKSELHGLRGGKKKKKEEKLNSSRIRFQEQIVGRPIKKDPPDFSGACFEMGLMRVKFEDDECLVTLSETGYEFALMENPILDSDEYIRAFSNEEIRFIKENIISKFQLENKIIELIMTELQSKELSADEIDKIFENEKLQYYHNLITDTDFKQKLINSSPSERVAMMGRLAELRIVHWNINKLGKSVYSLPEK